MCLSNFAAALHTDTLGGMKRILHTAVLLLIASGGGCQSNNAVIIDQLPDFIPKEQTHSTVMLTVGTDSDTRFGGSAIILSDTQLLTNRHVWVREDEWWNSDTFRRTTNRLFLHVQEV